MTKQELNRDIKRMYKSYFDKIYTLESNDFFNWIEESLKPEYKRLYFADNNASVLTLDSLKRMMIIYSKIQVIPFHTFYIEINEQKL